MDGKIYHDPDGRAFVPTGEVRAPMADEVYVSEPHGGVLQAVRDHPKHQVRVILRPAPLTP